MNVIYIVLEFLISFFIGLLASKKTKEYKCLTFFIIFTACLTRTLLIENYPVGLNQDEASIGYEAYSLLYYGIDRNGLSFPVHFISWGSGQNALYAYLIIPFIKLFGLNKFSIRLPMAIIGCISMLFFMHIAKIIAKDNKYLYILILIIFSFNPWHIMKSRWALESNVFPDLMLWAGVFIHKALNDKTTYFYLSSLILGISCYAYGTSYLYVPILFFSIYIYLLTKKKITFTTSIKNLFLIILLSGPMILFVIINYFDLNTIRIGFIAIPKLYFNRFTDITSVNGNFLSNCLSNLLNSIKLLLTGYDGSRLNAVKYIGTLYPITVLFSICGLFFTFTKNKLEYGILNCFLIASLIIMLFVEPNINRINVVWILILIYSTICIKIICLHKRILANYFIAFYLLCFFIFEGYYYTKYQKDISEITFDGYLDALEYINNIPCENIYITDNINQPYIYYLYVNKHNPNDYLNNRVVSNLIDAFQHIESIGNTYFYIPNTISKGNAYIINSNNLNDYIIPTSMNIMPFKNYILIY